VTKNEFCHRKPNVHATGTVFGLPRFPDAESEQATVKSTRIWSWPAGHSTKTEFNIDLRMVILLNGRQEAL
jgi:hypothetical protein